MKCYYCGEEEATDKVANPNLDMGLDIDWTDENNWWQVCKDCKEVIPLQRMSSIPDEKLQKYCNEKLQAIAERTKKPIMRSVIYKKEDRKIGSVSVIYTGDK